MRREILRLMWKVMTPVGSAHALPLKKRLLRELICRLRTAHSLKINMQRRITMIQIAVLGYGTVGSGVVEAIQVDTYPSMS